MPCQWIEVSSFEAIGDVDRHLLAFLPAQGRRRDLAVDREDAALLAVDDDVGAIDHQIVGGGEGRRRRQQGQRRARRERL